MGSTAVPIVALSPAVHFFAVPSCCLFGAGTSTAVAACVLPAISNFPRVDIYCKIYNHSSIYLAKADNPNAQTRRRHQDNSTMAKNNKKGSSKAARKQAGIQVSFWYYWLTVAMRVWSVARQCDNLRIGGLIAVVNFIGRSLLHCVLS